MKLIVLNLPRDVSEEALAQLFKAHGGITACTIVLDAQTGLSKGFGFVEMPRADEAAAAIGALNGSVMGKNKIRVKVASEPSVNP